jgi:hypothetical protein
MIYMHVIQSGHRLLQSGTKQTNNLHKEPSLELSGLSRIQYNLNFVVFPLWLSCLHFDLRAIIYSSVIQT